MKYLSASTINTHIKCPRKAVLQAMFPQPSTGAQTRGTELHDALERYLCGETEVVEDELGDWARKLDLLPNPSADILVEFGLGKINADAERYERVRRWTDCQEMIGDVPIRGIVDLIRFDRGHLEIWDHKTTSGWNWTETEQTLRQNVQAWLYAEMTCRWLEQEGRDFGDRITIGHIQYLKPRELKTKVNLPTAANVRAVSITTSRKEVARKWTLLEAVALEMIGTRGLAANEVVGDRGHCGAFGGCQFRNLCGSFTSEAESVKGAAVARWRMSL